MDSHLAALSCAGPIVNTTISASRVWDNQEVGSGLNVFSSKSLIWGTVKWSIYQAEVGAKLNGRLGGDGIAPWWPAPPCRRLAFCAACWDICGFPSCHDPWWQDAAVRYCLPGAFRLINLCTVNLGPTSRPHITLVWVRAGWLRWQNDREVAYCDVMQCLKAARQQLLDPCESEGMQTIDGNADMNYGDRRLSRDRL